MPSIAREVVGVLARSKRQRGVVDIWVSLEIMADDPVQFAKKYARNKCRLFTQPTLSLESDEIAQTDRCPFPK